jgi:DmsE family decaheme c-type cytochrome
MWVVSTTFFAFLVMMWAVSAGGYLIASDEASSFKENTNACTPCHEEVVAAFMKKPHAVIDFKGWTAKDYKSSCTSCHGGATKHLEDEGGTDNIFTFSSEDKTIKKIKKCLACHQSDSARFFASPHGKASLDCGECHTIHGKMVYRPLLKKSPSKSCGKCHQDVLAKFMLNERHRLMEGVLGCTSCHNPHEPSITERLAGFKHQACLKCHVDKGGPYLYEHAAGMIEGCSACHEVHGSPNRHMLHQQSTGDLCFSCHVGAPSWHERFKTFGTNCAICHSTIHGSNLSKIFLK